MNSLAYNAKRKNSNYLIDNLLEFERNTKHLKDTVEWYFEDYESIDLIRRDNYTIIEHCYYITENNQIAVNKSFVTNEKTIFILHVNNILSSVNDFFKIIPNTRPSNFCIIQLDNFLTEYKIAVTVSEMDIKFIKDLKLRKLNYCIECGLCGKTCPMSLFNNSFQPIQHIRKEVIKHGYVRDQLCTGCSKCNSICPVGIELSDYFLFYNKPKDWKEHWLNKALNTKIIAPYVFQLIK